MALVVVVGCRGGLQPEDSSYRSFTTHFCRVLGALFALRGFFGRGFFSREVAAGRDGFALGVELGLAFGEVPAQHHFAFGVADEAGGKGTVFLADKFVDEIGFAFGEKLLRVLEEGMFRRVGGLRDIHFDARIVAASNRDLKRESEEGNFRLDLYYRLSVIQIDIPPLNERGDDVLLLAQYYIEKANQKRRGKLLKGLSKETAQIFTHYAWAGNVRELRNVIERASILEDGEWIATDYLPQDLLRNVGQTSAKNFAKFHLPTDGIALESVELELARQAIERTGGNLTRAAQLLHISRDQLRYKLKKSGDYKDNLAE